MFNPNIITSVKTAGVFLLYKNKFAFMIGPNKSEDKLGVVRLGGHIEGNEDVITCARREVKEEASVRIDIASSPITYWKRNWEDVTCEVIDGSIFDIRPLVIKGDEAGSTMLFLAYTQEQLFPAAETHGIVLLSEQEVFEICNSRIALSTFVSRGGEFIQAKAMNLDLEMNAGPHVKFLCDLLIQNDNAIRRFIEQG